MVDKPNHQIHLKYPVCSFSSLTIEPNEKNRIFLSMEKEKLTYIEETGLLMEQFGLARMAGRVLGYLMVCDKEAVSFDDIREALNASKGSISGTMKSLQNVGFVEAVSLPGDRKTYYRMSRLDPGKLMQKRMELLGVFGNHLKKGHGLKNSEDEVSTWLHETSAFYLWAKTELQKMIETWEEKKSSILNK